MVTSLVAGVVAALLYGIATVMQAVAVREASTRELGAGSGVDPGLLVRMLSQWRFLASICLDLLGFARSSSRCSGCRCSPCRPWWRRTWR